MLTIIAIIIGTYFLIGMIVIISWEVTTEIVGVFDTPDWLNKIYNFVVEKWFFFVR